MNRTIKFRVWDEKGKVMSYDPDYGTSLFFSEETPDFMKSGIRQTVSFPLNQIFKEQGVIYMQFTGLLDRTGKEIYEGDIVEFMRAGKIRRRVVEWEILRDGWSAIYLNPLGQEVIGNIHENPELLNSPS